MGVISPHLVVKTTVRNGTAPEAKWGPRGTAFKGKGKVREKETLTMP